MSQDVTPIDPLLDQLIKRFKDFQTVVFPRSMPQPVSHWKPVLQSLTQYEALVAKTTSDYLCGGTVKTESIDVPLIVKSTQSDLKIRDSKDSDYLKSLLEYQKQIETMAYLVQDCAKELGNPCQKFRA